MWFPGGGLLCPFWDLFSVSEDGGPAMLRLDPFLVYPFASSGLQ